MSFISKDHFHMALKGVRSFLNQKADKSELDKLHEDILDEVTKSGVQSDWNETNKDSNAYIKNKPFEERELEYTFVDLEKAPASGQGAATLSSTCEYELIPGNMYRVIIDGVEKEVKCIVLDDFPNYRYLMLDDTSAWNKNAIFQYTGRINEILSFTPWSYSGTASVKVIGKTLGVTKLDEKFIPDTFVKESDIASTNKYGITKLSNAVNQYDATTAASTYAVTTVYASALLKSGGTMKGDLTLKQDPTSNLHAATKQYVDNKALLRSGGTMTGVLTLKGDPTSNLHAATKQYVDNAIPDAVPTPATAKAGQTIMVESVDENGKPTSWKPVDVVIKNLDDITTMKETNLQCGFYYRLSDPLPDGWYYYDDTKYGSKIPTLVVINNENTAVAGTMLLNAASLMYITSSETYINVVVYAKNGGVTIYGYNLETNEADYYREAVYSTTRADYLLNQKISSPKVAEVNQLLSVKTIDENGKPIEWEVVDRTHYDDGETIKQLDEKFIPDTIARVADIPVVPVTSVNGMTGDVVIEVSGGSGSGGVSSWNDLTDKPFYEKDIEIDIQWDGVSGDIKVDIGDVPASYVSDYVLSNENLIGMTINMVTQGENNERTEETITIEPEHIIAYSSDVMMVAEGMLVVHRENAELMGIQFPKVGIYFVNFDGNYISSLNGTTTILKKLENKYIDSHDSVTINLSYVYNEETDEYTDVVVNQTFVNVLNSYRNGQGIYVSVNEENNTYRYPVDVIAIGEGGIVYGVYLLFTDINGNNMALLLSMDGQIDLITSPFVSSSSGLPEVTEENNGQILGVTDGAWSVMDAPSGLPEVSSTDNGKVLTVTDGAWVASEIAVTSVNGQTGDIQIDIPEVPVALPNPNTITFTGVVEATYDGSSAVSVEIPSGLPEVAAENEGAFLRIVNGVPTWVVLEVAEEGAY